MKHAVKWEVNTSHMQSRKEELGYITKFSHSVLSMPFVVVHFSFVLCIFVGVLLKSLYKCTNLDWNGRKSHENNKSWKREYLGFVYWVDTETRFFRLFCVFGEFHARSLYRCPLGCVYAWNFENIQVKFLISVPPNTNRCSVYPAVRVAQSVQTWTRRNWLLYVPVTAKYTHETEESRRSDRSQMFKYQRVRTSVVRNFSWQFHFQYFFAVFSSRRKMGMPRQF